ncbi:MAG TPA: PLD nuclease N-terminal domain-containing protein [Ktedonobacterales bacterium]|jgi:hypothetical protein
MGRLIDAVLAVWRIRRMGRVGTRARVLLALEITLAIVALFFPIVGQAALTVDVFTQRVVVSEKIAWTVLIWVLPFLGPLLYVFFGPRHKPTHITLPQPAQAQPAQPQSVPRR